MRISTNWIIQAISESNFNTLLKLSTVKIELYQKIWKLTQHVNRTSDTFKWQRKQSSIANVSTMVLNPRIFAQQQRQQQTVKKSGLNKQSNFDDFYMRWFLDRIVNVIGDLRGRRLRGCSQNYVTLLAGGGSDDRLRMTSAWRHRNQINR